ncbi:hypothetical protein HK098_007353 [Nowakowskiella sp. JEL0407]|nr:hypothetical protein HK098_007353 [Nowakowskiella sp. JEL0407]
MQNNDDEELRARLDRLKSGFDVLSSPSDKNNQAALPSDEQIRSRLRDLTGSEPPSLSPKPTQQTSKFTPSFQTPDFEFPQDEIEAFLNDESLLSSLNVSVGYEDEHITPKLHDLPQQDSPSTLEEAKLIADVIQEIRNQDNTKNPRSTFVDYNELAWGTSSSPSKSKKIDTEILDPEVAKLMQELPVTPTKLPKLGKGAFDGDEEVLNSKVLGLKISDGLDDEAFNLMQKISEEVHLDNKHKEIADSYEKKFAERVSGLKEYMTASGMPPLAKLANQDPEMRLGEPPRPPSVTDFTVFDSKKGKKKGAGSSTDDDDSSSESEVETDLESESSEE